MTNREQLYVFPMPQADGTTWAWVELWPKDNTGPTYLPTPYRDVQAAYRVISALPMNALSVVDWMDDSSHELPQMVRAAQRMAHAEGRC